MVLLLRMSIFAAAMIICLVIGISTVEARREHKEHHHYKPSYKKDENNNLLHEKQLVRDKEHLREDIKDYYNLELSDDMSEEEMEFYYFQLHDMDHNGKLDGLEILTALNHIIDDPGDIPASTGDPTAADKADTSKQREWNEKFEADSGLIDILLKDNDLDEDGYISYLEFALGRIQEKRKNAAS